ncbi:hypothetical protein C8Q74DRAFT_1363695 [Fomes fomentarius]|nr:hypothetical protein C8Q74DRAFT_1363695 [Fomes fomentarius]
MAHWFDYLSLFLTLSIFAAIAYVYLNAKKAWSGAVASTKDSLKSKGMDLSSSGLSVKTDKRFDREQYLDATQRGFIKAFNASSAGNHDLDAPDDAQKKGRGMRLIGRRSKTLEK